MCDGDSLAPFEARYAVARNGKPVGNARVHLKKNDSGWVYRMDTEARRGLAGILGAEITEISRFEMVNGEPRPREYRYEQGVAFSRRTAQASFDWHRLQVRGEYKDDDFTLPLRPGQSDRMLVNLKLMMALARGAADLTFDSVDKGRVERLSFERLGDTETIETPEGAVSAVQVARKHRNPNRSTHSWHAAEFAYLPVRMQQVDREDDEIIEMTLKRWTWADCQS